MTALPPAPAASGEAGRNEADLAFRGAVSGADAYRTTRAALRLEGEVLRVGNRFVRADRYREIGFVAVGRAAVSQAFAISDALGERLTQGYVAGPDPLPEAVPFQNFRTTQNRIGGAEAETVSAAAVELAGGLKAEDLLVVALSPGALGLLATPPPGLGAAAYREWVDRLRGGGASARGIERFVRVTGDGAVGGRLAEAGPAAILPIVVDRGGGAELVGGGPTRPVGDAERAEVRELLAGSSGPAAVPVELTRAIARAPPLAERPAVRPVVVATPADALQGAGDALSEAKWWSRLAELGLPGPPEEAAERFQLRIDERLREIPRSRELRRGVALFAGAPLECPDGEGEGEALARLLPILRSTARHRSLTFVVFRTSGSRAVDTGLSAGILGAGGGEIRPVPAFAAGRPGVTDVGPVVVALRPERAEP